MRSGKSDHRMAQELIRPSPSLVPGKVRHARVVGNLDQCDRLCGLSRRRDLSPIARQQIAGSLSATVARSWPAYSHPSAMDQRPAHDAGDSSDRAGAKKTPFVLLERTGGAFSGTAAGLRYHYLTGLICAADPRDRAPLVCPCATRTTVEPFWRHQYSSKKVLP